MPPLVPHLLLRTNLAHSETAIALRNANYLVSRVDNDESAVELANHGHIDAIVTDLPLLAAVKCASAAIASGASVPILVISSVGERVLPFIQGAFVIKDSRDLVSGVDLMLARFKGYDNRIAS